MSWKYQVFKKSYETNDKISKSSHQTCSVNKVFLEISQNSQENTCARDSFLIVAGGALQASHLLKKSLMQNFIFCEILVRITNLWNKYTRKNTANNTLISPNSLVSWCGDFVERHSLHKVSGKFPETMRKHCLSKKFSH